jgi:hypothetical protein
MERKYAINDEGFRRRYGFICAGLGSPVARDGV